MAASVLGGMALPAYADDPSISITSLDTTTFQAGSQATMQFVVKGGTTGGSFTIKASSSLAPDVTLKRSGNSCGAACTWVDTIPPGGAATYTITIVAAQNLTTVQAGQQKTGTIALEANPALQGANTATKSQSITLQGPVATTTAPTSVPQVSGTVKDIATGTPINQAVVAMQDSGNHNCSTGTNSTGAFVFKNCNGAPITPGTLAIIVKKTGYQDRSMPADAVAGQNLNLAIVLTATASPSAGAPASDAGLLPSADMSGINSPVAAAGAVTTKSGGGSGMSTIIIVLGIILVLAGIGVIVLIMWRRREAGGATEGGDDDAPRRGPTPVPAARGGYRGAPTDATAVVRSGGYDDRHDPLADAPTMLQSRPIVEDEYPDPYGAPPPGAAPAYGAAAEPGYGPPADPYGEGPGYGAGAGYGGTERYSEPTGVYTPPGQRPPADPYGQREYAGGGYGADERTGYDGGGYDQPTHPAGNGGFGGGEYGEPTRPAGYGDGYDRGGSTGGYEQPDPTRRYEGGQDYGSGGYDQPTQRGGAGYGGSGYGPGGGYDQPTTPGGAGYRAQGGYDQPAPPGGYGESYGGGYGGGAPTSGSGYGGGRPTSGAGYGDEPGYEPRGGYQPRGGYPQAGGYDQQPPTRHGSAPEQRRPLDWLDD